MSQSGTACIPETDAHAIEAVDQDAEGRGHIQELSAEC